MFLQFFAAQTSKLDKKGKHHKIVYEHVHKRGSPLPKIIEKVREQLLVEVKKQIMERGYSQTTIRSVASACNVGVGTVYNYFSSKDMLIATVVAEDWNIYTEQFKTTAKTSNPKETIKLIYNMLQSFSEMHKTLFSDPEAVKKFSSIFTERHSILRNQIAEFVLPLCQDSSQFLSQFISESLLAWFMEGISFEELYSVIKKLL